MYARKFKLQNYEPSLDDLSKINQELKRIGRDKEQIRNASGSSYKYTAVVKIIGKNKLWIELSGPSKDRLHGLDSLCVSFHIEKRPGLIVPDISILFRDKYTNYEEAIKLAKHSVGRFLKKLPEKPFELDDGIDKSSWSGHYLSHTKNEVNLNFDENFDKAERQKFFHPHFRDTLRDMGFNIDCHWPYCKLEHKSKHIAKTNKKFHLELLA